MNKEKILELVIRTIPYSNKIKNINFESDYDAVIFQWREKTYRASSSSKYTIYIEEVGDGVLIGSDISIIMECLLKRNLNIIDDEIENKDE